MKEFVFWYSETTTYKAYFAAASEKEAAELINKLRAGEISLEDLPQFDKKLKSYELDADAPELNE